MLSPDERERAARFKAARDCRQFVSTRFLLRQLLGMYLNCDSSSVRFSYRRSGKPYLAQGSTDKSLSFNLSHAGCMAVLAFAQGREVGVDVESVDRTVQVRDLSRRFFSPQELAEIESSLSGVTSRFFEVWTRKEAVAKAVGRGLLASSSFIESRPANWSRLSGWSSSGEGYSVWHFVPAPGYVGALAANGGFCRVLSQPIVLDYQAERFIRFAAPSYLLS